MPKPKEIKNQLPAPALKEQFAVEGGGMKKRMV